MIDKWEECADCSCPSGSFKNGCPRVSIAPDPPRPPKKRGDLFWVIFMEVAPFVVVCIAALVGGRIAGLW